jgi:hypothetical protein
MCTRGINGDPSAPGPTQMSTAADLLSDPAVTELKVSWLWSQQLACGPYQSTPPYPVRFVSSLILSFHLLLSHSSLTFRVPTHIVRSFPQYVCRLRVHSQLFLFSVNVITSLSIPLPHSHVRTISRMSFLLGFLVIPSVHNLKFNCECASGGLCPTSCEVCDCVLWAEPH